MSKFGIRLARDDGTLYGDCTECGADVLNWGRYCDKHLAEYDNQERIKRADRRRKEQNDG